MKLLRVPEQSGKFKLFDSLLRKELPRFVRQHPSVCRAVIKYGMLPDLVDSIPDFHHLGTLPDDPLKRRRMLFKALAGGMPPTVMVMGHGMMLSGNDDWFGNFNPGTGYITVYRPLVEQWELKPDNKVLRRGVIAVVLHELVHYFNEQIIPSSKINTQPGHLRATFHREAFAPLGWERAHYDLINSSSQCGK